MFCFLAGCLCRVVIEQVVGRVGQTRVERHQPQARSRVCRGSHWQGERVGRVPDQVERLTVRLEPERLQHDVVKAPDRVRRPIACGLTGCGPRVEEPATRTPQGATSRRLAPALGRVPRRAQVPEVTTDNGVQVVVREELTPVGDRRKRHRLTPKDAETPGAAAPSTVGLQYMTGEETDTLPLCRIRFSDAR